MGIYIPNMDEKKFYELCKEHNLDFIAIPADDMRPVVRGEWIVDGHHIICSACNEYLCIKDEEHNEIPREFCPNCGAYMRPTSMSGANGEKS